MLDRGQCLAVGDAVAGQLVGNGIAANAPAFLAAGSSWRGDVERVVAKRTTVANATSVAAIARAAFEYGIAVTACGVGTEWYDPLCDRGMLMLWWAAIIPRFMMAARAYPPGVGFLHKCHAQYP